MKIDIKELINKPEYCFKGKQIVSLEHLASQTSSPICEMNVEGTVTRDQNRYHVTGKVTGILPLRCDRCMKAIQYPIDLLLEETLFSPQQGAVPEDNKIIDGSTIDLSELISEMIYLNLPMKVLCKSNCKGICTQCGQDLNEQICTCQKSDIDPRLEKLKSIFHPQSEE